MVVLDMRMAAAERGAVVVAFVRTRAAGLTAKRMTASGDAGFEERQERSTTRVVREKNETDNGEEGLWESEEFSFFVDTNCDR